LSLFFFQCEKPDNNDKKCHDQSMRSECRSIKSRSIDNVFLADMLICILDTTRITCPISELKLGDISLTSEMLFLNTYFPPLEGYRCRQARGGQLYC
jgi:hypothetical protein